MRVCIGKRIKSKGKTGCDENKTHIDNVHELTHMHTHPCTYPHIHPHVHWCMYTHMTSIVLQFPYLGELVCVVGREEGEQEEGKEGGRERGRKGERKEGREGGREEGREGGRERGRKGERKEGREGGRERGRKGEREEGREGGRERGRKGEREDKYWRKGEENKMHSQDWVKKKDAYVDTQTGTKGGREAEG